MKEQAVRMVAGGTEYEKTGSMDGGRWYRR
jgi:hypothetical protein